jgi:hypothetical protein
MFKILNIIDALIVFEFLPFAKFISWPFSSVVEAELSCGQNIFCLSEEKRFMFTDQTNQIRLGSRDLKPGWFPPNGFSLSVCFFYP